MDAPKPGTGGASPTLLSFEAAASEWGVAVRTALRAAHEMAAAQPIRHPDQRGAFATRWPSGLLPGGVAPIVADANILLRDVGYRCRRGRRTILVTAANVDSIRIFCASHVIDEVFEHGARWAVDRGIEPSRFLAVWVEEYLPLIREVRPGDVDASWLTAAERFRLDVLDVEDPDDRPSATLSLLLGAFYLSSDRAALEAVYGPHVDVAVHDEWLETLGASGDAGELGRLMFGTFALAAIVGKGAWELGRWALRTIPVFGIGAAIGGAAVGARRVSSERWRTVGRGALKGLSAAGEVFGQYQLFVEKLTAASVPPPSTEDAAQIAADAIRARRCLYELARHAGVHASAVELAHVLPDLGVGQGEKLIRATLRGATVFRQVGSGRWQVGHPADLASRIRRLVAGRGTAEPHHLAG